MKSQDKDWLGTIAVGLIAGIFGLALHSSLKQNKETQERRSKYCSFDKEISQLHFNQIVKKCASKFKRVRIISIDGPYVKGEVTSQSGLSTWDFEIDYNDYGNITGKYWLFQDNSDASIPGHLADNISEVINGYIVESKDLVTNNSITLPHVKKKKNRKLVTFFILLLILALIILFGYYEYSQLIPIGYDSQHLVGKEYNNVVNLLKKKGFYYIKTLKEEDLDVANINHEFEVSDVKMLLYDDFRTNTLYPANFPITVKYHVIKKIALPISSKEAKDLQHEELLNIFKDAGFINVTMNVKYDIITGFFKDVGEIDSVKIEENKQFEEGDLYRPEAEIIITYHDLIKKAPK